MIPVLIHFSETDLKCTPYLLVTLSDSNPSQSLPYMVQQAQSNCIAMNFSIMNMTIYQNSWHKTIYNQTPSSVWFSFSPQHHSATMYSSSKHSWNPYGKFCQYVAVAPSYSITPHTRYRKTFYEAGTLWTYYNCWYTATMKGSGSHAGTSSLPNMVFLHTSGPPHCSMLQKTNIWGRSEDGANLNMTCNVSILIGVLWTRIVPCVIWNIDTAMILQYTCIIIGMNAHMCIHVHTHAQHTQHT